MAAIEYFLNFEDQPISATLVLNTYDDLKREISTRFGLAEFEVSYLDDEDDSIKITSNIEFKEAHSFAVNNDNLLILTIKTKPAEVLPEPVVSEPTTPEVVNPFVDFACKLFGVNPEDVRLDFTDRVSKASEALNSGVNEFKNAVEEVKIEIENKITGLVEKAAEASVPQKPEEYHNAFCNSCSATIVGIRYKCLLCPDYDLCATCEAKNPAGEIHDGAHYFAKLYNASQKLPERFGRKTRKCGKGGPRNRIIALETEVKAIREALVAFQSAPVQEPEPVVPEPVAVSEPLDNSVIIEDVPVVEDVPVPAPVVDELEQFRSMGFTEEDFPRIRRLMLEHNNDVNFVLNVLLGY